MQQHKNNTNVRGILLIYAGIINKARMFQTLSNKHFLYHNHRKYVYSLALMLVLHYIDLKQSSFYSQNMPLIKVILSMGIDKI